MLAEPATQVPGDPTRQSLRRRLILGLLCFGGWGRGEKKGLEDSKSMWGARALRLGWGEGVMGFMVAKGDMGPGCMGTLEPGSTESQVHTYKEGMRVLF